MRVKGMEGGKEGGREGGKEGGKGVCWWSTNIRAVVHTLPRRVRLKNALERIMFCLGFVLFLFPFFYSYMLGLAVLSIRMPCLYLLILFFSSRFWALCLSQG